MSQIHTPDLEILPRLWYSAHRSQADAVKFTKFAVKNTPFCLSNFGGRMKWKKFWIS
nr:MAG TPA: NifQ [Caudoviricetes sp.]